MTHSCLAHWPSHFFLHRKAQSRASFISSMEASADGHWCCAEGDFPLVTSSSSYDSYELLTASASSKEPKYYHFFWEVFNWNIKGMKWRQTMEQWCESVMTITWYTWKHQDANTTIKAQYYVKIHHHVKGTTGTFLREIRDELIEIWIIWGL